ncbi:MAG: hypothetical protein QOE70_159 [Chthoniobacter sp.]|jgi:polyisoprenoid-binding protein YceI|nr:hypothetical protein [Chthoniobacter sp.]
MKHTFLLCSALFLVGASAFAGTETYKIDPVHSTIGFKIRHFFSKVGGRFNEVAGTIQGDPAKPDDAQVSVTIQTKSIDTAEAKRDTHLRSPDFFDVEKFPAMTFVSKKVTRTGDNTADVTGDLTLHGVTKDVTLKVTFLGKGKTMNEAITTGWEATTKIKRSEFGLTWNKVVEGTSAVGDDVEIELQVEAALVKAG